jgi:hypothetical protein
MSYSLVEPGLVGERRTKAGMGFRVFWFEPQRKEEGKSKK